MLSDKLQFVASCLQAQGSFDLAREVPEVAALAGRGTDSLGPNLSAVAHLFRAFLSLSDIGVVTAISSTVLTVVLRCVRALEDERHPLHRRL